MHADCHWPRARELPIAALPSPAALMASPTHSAAAARPCPAQPPATPRPQPKAGAAAYPGRQRDSATESSGERCRCPQITIRHAPLLVLCLPLASRVSLSASCMIDALCPTLPSWLQAFVDSRQAYKYALPCGLHLEVLHQQPAAGSTHAQPRAAAATAVPQSPPPILFLHGAMHGAWCWQVQMPLLSISYACC